MKLVGFVGGDFNVDQLTALGANVQHRGSFVANLVVRPYNAYIQFDSYDENRYRPYLQLDAELIGGRGSFGNDVTEFGYRENDYLNRSVRYDFTDHELALLVEKGLYQPDFEVPEIFTDTDFEIPIEMDITEVELNGNRLIYASYDMISDLQTDSEKSGYNLVEYFEEQHYESEKSNDFEDQYVDENEFVAEVAERQAEDEVTEPVVEEKPTAEEISETPKENKTKKNSLKSKFSKTKEKKEEKNISPVKEKSKKKSAKIKPENELALEEKSEPKQVKQKPPKKDKYSTKGCK